MKIKVKLIFRRRTAAIVEWWNDGVPRRVSIPEELLKVQEGGDFILDEDDFEMGIPYGLPISDQLNSIRIDPEKLENELHLAGIWTAKDVISNPKVVQGAILASAKELLHGLSNLAKEFLIKER